MIILITGAAGFIGFHTSKKLLKLGHTVYGVDNVNDYYDTSLKFDRLKELGIDKKTAVLFNKETKSSKYRFRFLRINLEDKKKVENLFKRNTFDKVCHLAAQAGVRYSLKNPNAYIKSNIIGFFNIIEACRENKISHLLYASSSSVYGNNNEIPFKTSDSVDRPISLYAATKKSNELIAHSYSHLYRIKTTGMRFFTVYGPWGRPDMAYYLFTKAIINNKEINIFNNGELERDFTYIDDIVSGIIKIILSKKKIKRYKIYNIGNNKTEKLKSFIKKIEKKLEKKALKKMMPMQKGDVLRTFANIDEMKKDFDYNPKTSVSKGMSNFVDWYLEYNKKEMKKQIEDKKILVTGGAGFIGSNLCEKLVNNGSRVVCLDNFVTGKKENIAKLTNKKNFELIEGDIRNIKDCYKATNMVDFVLHQAALGSVPRSVKDPKKQTM